MMNRLAESSGTLKKLSFNVIRVVDVSRWATDGEVKLIDCRKAGQFNGRGSLERVASTDLKPVWEKGSASEIRTAMRSEEHTSELPVTNAHLVCRLLLEKKKK